MASLHYDQPPFILVDGSYYLFRAFHALPPLQTTTGIPTNAVRGAISAMQKLIKRFNPSHMAVIFDTPEPTFRHQLSPDYKAHRPEMPSELSIQIPYLHQLIQALGIPLLLLPGAEADDLIGTLAKHAEREGYHVLISTGDKDMAQLVNDVITLEDSFRERVMDFDGVVEKFGVRPNQIIDYLTLMGDASDGISGIPGIGAKTAAKLLQEYDTIGNLLAHSDEIKGKMGEKLRDNAHLIPLNHQLASIVCDLPLQFTWHDLKIGNPDKTVLTRLYTELEFKTSLQALEQTATQHENIPNTSTAQTTIPEPRHELAAITRLNQNSPIRRSGENAEYTAVLDMMALEALITRIRQQGIFAIDTETTSIYYRQAKLVGISLCLQANEAFYIPLTHDYMGAPAQLTLSEVLNRLKPILEDSQYQKVGHHLKYDAHIFQNHGVTLRGWGFDTMLASYLIHPTNTRHNMDDLANYYLNHQTTLFEDVAGKGAKQISFNQVDVSKATQYACEDADITWQLYKHFAPYIAQNETLNTLFYQTDLPVAEILWMMEENGIHIDAQVLRQLEGQFGEAITKLEQRAYEIAGQPFNVSSPKQTGEILFDTLQIAGGKKTASGQYATSEAVLEKIDHPLAAVLLEHRGLSKLKNTYTQKLISLADAKTQRIHTSYHQASTATGRLSSTDPNLQNIPIRDETGRLIRRAFIAESGYTLLAADYSQIELRLMAHFSQDTALVDAFNQGQDIHQRTAAEILGIDLHAVTADQRRNAKAINFGLLYGMSAFGLAKQINSSREEAQQYINRYFSRYPGVLTYMENTRTLAHDQGFVETLVGRRLYTPDINSSNAHIRQGAERAAINAPLQGSAADIIKLAMLAVVPLMVESGSRLLLQVHDELVFEIPSDRIEVMTSRINQAMSSVIDLSVPLLVGTGIGHNWDQAH